MKNTDKYQRYQTASRLLACPICGSMLELKDRVLVCAGRHSFDIARQGYVNLYRGKPVNEYSKDSFLQRQQILEKGMYTHILDEICGFLEGTCQGQASTLLDAGCGEGYYTREIARRLGETCRPDLYGVDLSRDSIQLAASTANQIGGAAADIKWVVADISHLPAGDGTVDFLLDVFTSANYQEFQRVLADDGCLIKVIPGEGHVKELREAASDQLHHKDYKARKGAEVFAEQFNVILQKTVSKTFPVTPEERDIFINMTPLLFQVDKSKVDWTQVETITVEGQLLIGKKKKDR